MSLKSEERKRISFYYHGRGGERGIRTLDTVTRVTP